MSSSCSDLVVRLDILSKNFNFYINGSYKYKTFLGGILSVLIFLGVAVLVWYFGQDLYLKKQPKLLVSNDFLSDYPFTTVTQDKFNIAFRLEDNNTNLIDNPAYFDYRFSLLKSYYDSNGNFILETVYEQIPERCCEKHLSVDTLKKYKLYNYYCVNSNYTFGGSWTSSEIYLPVFSIVACDKTTELRYNVKCIDKFNFFENIKKTVYMDIFYQKDIFDSRDVYNPIRKNLALGDYTTNVKNNITKQLSLRYSIADIHTDTGIIFQEFANETFLKFETISSNDLPNVNFYSSYLNYDIIGIIVLYMDKSITTYSRSYIKIPEVLATVGGFMNSILKIIEIVYFPFWDNDIWHFLQSRLYKLEIEEVQDEKENNYMNEINIELKNIPLDNWRSFDFYFNPAENSSNNSILPGSTIISRTRFAKGKHFTSLKDLVLNKDLKQYNENKKKLKTKEIHVDKWWKFCYLRVVCNSPTLASSSESKLKYEMTKAADEEFLKKIEIFNLFKDFDQFKIMKKIVLNEAQSFMIENMDRKSITNKYSDLTQKEINQIIEEKHSKKIKLLAKYLHEEKSHDGNDSVDSLLYRNLDSKVFEQIVSCTNKNQN